jgi:hypothetical protein
MHAKYQHNAAFVLRDANAARATTRHCVDATYLMVDTYLRPLVDALWAGESVPATTVTTAVSNSRQLLTSLPESARTTSRWKVWPEQACGT